MSMSLHQKLRTGRVILGLNLQYPAAGIIECIGAGWDWVWIDGQHGQHDYRSVLECVRVADSCGIAPVVRVSGHEPGLIGPAMDMRPAGIMVPMVNTVGEAQAIVKAARFPPLGERSYGGRRVIDLGTREYFKTADQDTILIVQLETKEALDNAAAIAATEGVDVPDELSQRLVGRVDLCVVGAVAQPRRQLVGGRVGLVGLEVVDPEEVGPLALEAVEPADR